MILTLAAAAATATPPPAEDAGIPLRWWIILTAAGLLLARLWWTRRTHPRIDTILGVVGIRSKSSATAQRWGNRADRKHGVATSFDILRRSSCLAMRARGKVIRPTTLADTGRIRRLCTVRTARVAIRLARAGLLHVWASLEDVTIVFGGPRTGKTAWLAGRIIDYPGMLIVTSTRPDIYEATARFRRDRGRTTYIFNPSALGGLDYRTSISFDPLTGCKDPERAAERAADMVGACSSGGGGDRAHWDGQARRVLASLMHAAALADLGMRDVLRWVSDPDAHKAEILRILRRSPAESMLPTVEQFIGTNDKTRSSITSGIMPALEWLNSASAAEAGSRQLWPFDVAELLEERATVYMLGSEEAYTAPLVAALTGYIAREARRLAADQRGGRLDPPLGLFLDEAANVAPVPLHQWSSHFGGSGITLLAAFQSRAQMIDRWGKDAAAIILNNAGAIMLFGGTKDTDDLDYWATLSGTRYARTPTYSATGTITGYSVSRVPVFSAPQLSQLPPWRVVIFRKSLLPCVGKVRPVWKRWDVKYADTYPGAGVAHGLVAVWQWLVAAWRWFAGLCRAKPAPEPIPDPVDDREPVGTPSGL